MPRWRERRDRDSYELAHAKLSEEKHRRPQHSANDDTPIGELTITHAIGLDTNPIDEQETDNGTEQADHI